MRIERASVADFEWVRETYDSIGFLPSEPSTEIILIAKDEGTSIGLGRLQPIDSKQWELGGIFVTPSMRGKGIARKIVLELLRQVTDQNEVWCLPYSHLNAFYQSFGFKPVSTCSGVPEKVKSKLDWCQSSVSGKTPVTLHRMSWNASHPSKE